MGAGIVRRLPKSITVDAYPTLGEGRAYVGVCPIVGPRRSLPSEGHRTEGSLWRDAIAGFGIGPAMAFIRNEAKAYDAIIVVGDLLGVIMCWMSGNRVRIYVDAYKSGYDNRYSGLEKWLVERTCDLVLTRDAILAKQLRNARFAGNIIMDTLATGAFNAASKRKHPRAIAILPGSRESMRENFEVQAAALKLVPNIADIDLFMAVARPEDANAFADLAKPLGIHTASGSLGAILTATDIVLGQAGTANLQALGLGKPVVSFFAENTTDKRRRQNNAFAGDSRIFTERSPQALADAMTRLLMDDADRNRRGAIGKERMGPPGAIDAIVAELSR